MFIWWTTKPKKDPGASVRESLQEEKLLSKSWPKLVSQEIEVTKPWIQLPFLTFMVAF